MNYPSISHEYQNKPVPDEKARRVGRSIAAASLPEV